MTSSNTAEYKFYLKSGVIKFQFIIIILYPITLGGKTKEQRDMGF